MRYDKVFTPNDMPTVTYVDRAEHKLETKVRDFYRTPNMVVSVSGPSKSGKTVLIKKIVNEDYLITVRGASVSSSEDIWNHVLDRLGKPEEVEKSRNSSNETSLEAEGGGKIGIPFVAQGEAKGTLGAKRVWAKEEVRVFRRNGLEEVIREIAKSEFVVFIDDFHYIASGIRDDIGRQIKAAAESGVKIFTASVPHRADDVVRSNSELRGRVVAVDIEPWSVSDLVKIANKGFQALNVGLTTDVELGFAREAFGSPQLMQSICLNLALVLGTERKLEEFTPKEVTTEMVRDTLRRTSAFTDFSRMLRDLHIGAKTRGTERKEHDLIDGTRGDVYRAILIAMTQDPARLSFTYDEITTRVRNICRGDAPTGSSVNAALTQMHSIAESLQTGTSPLSWDDPTLDIVDPYFLFFLRCSDKLLQIASDRGDSTALVRSGNDRC